jgi:hypothetical protein
MQKEHAMEHVYAGQPDARQGDADLKPSRFRPRYRALTEQEKELHDQIKAKAEELGALFDRVKAGRYRALAMTALEEAVMWCVKGLTE